MHIEREKILAYVAGRLPDSEAFEIDIHLADCKKCAQRVRAHYFIRENFVAALKACSPPELTKDLNILRFRKAVKNPVIFADQESVPEVKSRLNKWLEMFPQKYQMGFEFIMETVGKKVEIIKEGMEAMGESMGSLFEPAPAFVRGGGTVPLCVEAVSAPMRPKITVDPVAAKVSIQIMEKERPWPLVLLWKLDEGQSSVTGFYHPEGADYLLAEFKGIPGGRYVLLIEPEWDDDKKDLGNAEGH